MGCRWKEDSSGRYHPDRYKTHLQWREWVGYLTQKRSLLMLNIDCAFMSLADKLYENLIYFKTLNTS